MNSKIIKISALTAVIVSVCVAYLWYTANTLGAEFPQKSNSPTQWASTTSFTLTGGATATRVVATSTRADATATLPATEGRSALTLQAINCLAGGAVWLQFNDVAAATNTTFFLGASTTRTFADTEPNVHGSVRALSATANCTLNVTEWRTEN